MLERPRPGFSAGHPVGSPNAGYPFLGFPSHDARGFLAACDALEMRAHPAAGHGLRLLGSDTPTKVEQAEKTLRRFMLRRPRADDEVRRCCLGQER